MLVGPYCVLDSPDISDAEYILWHNVLDFYVSQ